MTTAFTTFYVRASSVTINPNKSTLNEYSHNAVNCPLVLTNTSRSQLIQLINDTSVESVEGACALAALNYYNYSGALIKYNITANLTELNQRFQTGHPNITPLNSSNVENTFAQIPNIFCLVTPPFEAFWRLHDKNETRMLKCIAFSIKSKYIHHQNEYGHNQSKDKSNAIENISAPLPYFWNNSISNMNTGYNNNFNHNKFSNMFDISRFNITIPKNVTKGPEVIFIPSSKVATTSIEFINDTLVVINLSNNTNSNYTGKGLDNNVSRSDPTTANWAGYAAADGPFTNISGSWIVQNSLQTIRPYTRSSQWIGIGGAVSLPLIQIGTSSSNLFGSQAYGAWYEDFPKQQQININNFTVNPGDKIVASVKLISPINSILQTWQLKIKDINTNSSPKPIIIPFSGVNLIISEWIDERPGAICAGTSCIYYPFSNFINASFLSANATSTLGTSHSLSALEPQPISMVNQGILGSIDLSNNANPTNIINNAGSFKVENFRIGTLSSNRQNVTIGENYTIIPKTVYSNKTNQTVVGAAGGTGGYLYTWLEDKPGNNTYTNATDCYYLGYKYYKGSTCTIYTNSSTEGGIYEYKLDVHAGGGPSTEVVTAGPISINVIQTRSIPIFVLNLFGKTPAPFQQMITVNSIAVPGINANWSNVEFTTGPNATGDVLQSWVESGASNHSTNTVVWVKFTNGIPIGINEIYMDEMPANVMSANGPTGEAPQLSQVYGQYDNGNLVFNYYDNFANSTAGWSSSPNASAYASKGLYLTFDKNGSVIGPSENTGTAFDADIVSNTWSSLISSTTYSPISLLMTLGGGGATTTSSTTTATTTIPPQPYAEGDIGYININQSSTTPATSLSGTVIREACDNTYQDQITPTSDANKCGLVSNTLFSGTESATGIFTTVSVSSNDMDGYINYAEGKNESSPQIVAPGPSYPANIGFVHIVKNGGNINNLEIQWTRVRNVPPGGAMLPAVVLYPTAILNSTTTTSTTTI